MGQNLICPVCGDALKVILYGMPSPEDLESSEYIIGGCIIGENDPTHGCEKCDWSGDIADAQVS